MPPVFLAPRPARDVFDSLSGRRNTGGDGCACSQEQDRIRPSIRSERKRPGRAVQIASPGLSSSRAVATFLRI